MRYLMGVGGQRAPLSEPHCGQLQSVEPVAGRPARAPFPRNRSFVSQQMQQQQQSTKLFPLQTFLCLLSLTLSLFVVPSVATSPSNVEVPSSSSNPRSFAWSLSRTYFRPDQIAPHFPHAMAVGVLPGYFANQLLRIVQKVSHLTSPHVPARPSLEKHQQQSGKCGLQHESAAECLRSRNADSQSHLYSWDFVSLCDQYSIVHIVVSPPSSQCRSYPLSDGVSDGIGQQVTLQSSSQIYQALATAGFDLATSGGFAGFTLVLPTTDGYVERSDFLQLRLQDCPYPIARVRALVGPLQKYHAISRNCTLADGGLPTLIEHAAGIIQWADCGQSLSQLELRQHMLGLNKELKERLNNAQWLSPSPIPRRRVALVRGRPNLTAGGPIYNAAAALGLDLVIIDDEGHWLQADTPENRNLREAFLVTDMTEDAGVVDRIAKSIEDYPLPIDGIFTVSDNFFVTAAKVAEVLGLPHSPVPAFETSVDKYRSRMLQNVPGQTARVSGVDELQSLLTPSNDDQELFKPAFPMIVKPTKGWSSECVSKVNTLDDLTIAVEKATRRHGSAAVIEPFFDGPEIDVNFVLLDGEILFWEIADEPPAEADLSDATVHHTFSPVALTLPSALPEDEQEIARNTLRDILVRLGFKTGVFHVEARMVNSRVEYRNVANSVIDLVRKETAPIEDPSCRLLEINARPPGYRVSVPSRLTYGVDYFAVHMLAAVGDLDRLRLAAQSFDSPSTTDSKEVEVRQDRTHGAQYWSRLVYIPAPTEGVVKAWEQPPCEELKIRRPDLAKYIALGVDYCQPGEKISLFTDGARTYVAHILVFSRNSRREAIEIGDEVLRSFRMGVDEQEK
ncbi:carnosine synthase 1 [Diplogelasinospora grovesii]|uniref:Carnosine synthase 1 n=1 Tax=Diplogelasinospora grovesii TaxID=303347 RepID=A0AAN6N7J3_9PEZI|nr:carnosine synthase 1 [Diplogelasinospora grovesii]